LGTFEENKERVVKRTTKRRPMAVRLPDRVEYEGLVYRR